MNDKNLQKKLRKIYTANEGSRALIVHLIRNFLPISKSSYVITRPDDDKEMTCCVTYQKLVSKSEAIPEVQDALKKSSRLIAELKLKEDENVPDAIAVKCEGSDRYLSLGALKALEAFVENEVAIGNKHIDWVVKSKLPKKGEVKVEYKNISKDKNDKLFNRNKNQKVEYVKKPTITPTTFGELDALQKLKKDLEAKEKK